MILKLLIVNPLFYPQCNWSVNDVWLLSFHRNFLFSPWPLFHLLFWFTLVVWSVRVQWNYWTVSTTLVSSTHATHFHTQSALMFFVHCPVERCELSFIDLRYRVSVLSRWNGCPLPSMVWLEFSLFIEVVEKDSADIWKLCLVPFLNCSSAALIAMGWDILLAR